MQFIIMDRFGHWPETAPADNGQTIIRFVGTIGMTTASSPCSRQRYSIGTRAISMKLGAVKIMRRGQVSRERSYQLLPPSFTKLDPEFGSLGQELEFYEQLRLAGEAIAREYVGAMNDLAFNAELKAAFEDEEAFRVSLLRTSDALEALEKAASLFGGVEAEKVDTFEVRTQFPGAAGEHELQFDFRPYRGLPYRMSVLVGLNGVGKTALMARLAFLITRFEADAKEQQRTAAGETFESLGKITPRPSLYTVIAVSFSCL